MNIFRARILRHPPKAIWAAISTVESLPQWMPGVESARLVSGPAAGKGRRQRLIKQLYKRDIEIEQEVTAWEPEHLLAVRHLRETMGGRDLKGLRDFVMTVTITPNDKGGSRVLAQYEWTAGSFLPWLFSTLFAGRTMGRELRDSLAKIDEAASAAQNP